MLTGKEILERMAKAYAGCKSYQDTGVVKTVFIETERNWAEERPFTTTFVRPDRFRFEYWEKQGARHEGRYIVWRGGKQIRTWWDVRPGVSKPPSLGRALAGATGVSGGSAHTIPSLLLPDEIGGRKLTDMTKATRIEDAKLGDFECFRVHGDFAGNQMMLWIEKKTYLVRKIEEAEKSKDFRTLETTSYDPVIDGKVSEEVLDFKPPK
jgi:outer membrane lipoprotein-sorting protein